MAITLYKGDRKVNVLPAEVAKFKKDGWSDKSSPSASPQKKVEEVAKAVAKEPSGDPALQEEAVPKQSHKGTRNKFVKGK